MAVYYLIPVVVLVLVVVLSRWGQKRALASVQNMSPEEARAKMNDYYASSFELQPGEKLFCTWIGEEYQGEQSSAGQVAGAALNQLSKAAIGVSTYVPMVYIGLTTLGRVLVSREYSEMGSRGNFKQILALEPGTQALDAATARPGQIIKPPMKNPMQQAGAPEFVQFRDPKGASYEAWMHGGQVTEANFVAAFQNQTAQLAA